MMTLRDCIDAIKGLRQKLANIVKLAAVTNPSKDDGLDTISQIEYKGKVINAAMVYPYGVSANAPKDCSVLLFALGGSSQNPIGIPFFPENRVRDLKEGEFAVGNLLTTTCVKFKEDASVEVVMPDGESWTFQDGTEPVVRGDKFKDYAEGHTHSTAFGPSGAALPPYNPLTPDYFNPKVKV